MFKIITKLSVMLIGYLAQAQSDESTMANFNKIEVSNGIELILTQSANQTLRIEASNSSELKNVRAEVKNQTLILGKFQPDSAPIKVYASTSTIESIKLSSNAIARVTNQLNSNTQIRIVADSGSKFTGTLIAKTVLLDGRSDAVLNAMVTSDIFNGNFTANAKANVSGKSVLATINAYGGSLCLARNFITEKAEVNAAGKSKVMIYTQGILEIGIADNYSEIKYFGKPTKIKLPEDAITTRINTGQLLTQN